jgi:hypothetical protein
MTKVLSKIEELKTSRLLIFSALMAIVSIVPPWFHYDIIAEDGAFHYIPIAKIIIEGDILNALSQELPVYPLLVSVMSFLTGNNFELAGRILSAIFYVLSALGMFKLTHSAFNSKSAAILSVIFLITNRDLMDLGVDCLKETLVLCLIIWSSYFWISWMISQKRFLLVLSLVFFILGCLTRSTVAFFLLSCVFVWLFSERKWKLLIITTLGLLSIIMTFIFIIKFNIESLRNYNPVGLELNNEIFFHIIKYLECFFTGGNPVAFIIGVYGVILLYRKNIYAKIIASVFVISLIIFSMRYYISDRYMMPMVMMFYTISASVVTTCLYSNKKILKAIGFVVILYSLAQWGELALKKPEPRRLAIKQAGEWIYNNYGSDTSISTNQSRIIFYAGVQTPLSKRPELGKINFNNPSKIIAVDVSKDDGADIKKDIERRGGNLLNQIYPIYIYNFKK